MNKFANTVLEVLDTTEKIIVKPVSFYKMVSFAVVSFCLG